MPLTAKQRRFVEEYLIDLNATQAAIRAGYSEKTAKSVGQETLTKPDVLAAVQEAIAQRSERTETTQDQVLKELSRIGLSDLRKIFGEKGNLLNPSEWDEETASAISSVEVVTKSAGDKEVEYVHKVRLWDKPKALELLGKHLALFTDKLEVSGTLALEDRIRRGRARASSQD